MLRHIFPLYHPSKSRFVFAIIFFINMPCLLTNTRVNLHWKIFKLGNQHSLAHLLLRCFGSKLH